MTFPLPTVQTIPSFSVLDKDGNKVDTLIHCFIEHMLINPDDPSVLIKTKNGQQYQAVYETFTIPQDRKTNEPLKVIVSFQKHSYGRFAVIRNFKDKK